MFMTICLSAPYRYSNIYSTQGFRGILILCLQCLLAWVRFSMGLTPSLSGVSTWNCWLAEVIEVPKDQIARMQTLLMIYNDLDFASWKWLVDLQVPTKCTQVHQWYASLQQSFRSPLTHMPNMQTTHGSSQISTDISSCQASQAACIQDVLALVVEATRLGEEERSWMVWKWTTSWNDLFPWLV